MASPLVWTLGSVLIVSLISLIGALALTFRGLSRHGVMMFLVALAAGTLLGDTFLHILPEATRETGGLTVTMATIVIGGFLVMFVLEVVLRWRHSHAEHIDDVHMHASPATSDRVAPFGWLNLVSDGVHNFLDGVIIAAAFLVDIPLGIATALAVAAHEIPQELGDFAVLIRAGMSVPKALLLNLGSALVALLGAALVFLVGLPVEDLQHVALPLIAGAFLYIAAADLIPELHHHSKGRDALVILVGLLAGIALMAGLLGLEGVLPEAAGHDHG